MANYRGWPTKGGLDLVIKRDFVTVGVTSRWLTASDCPEGNRRDCSISGNQTSNEEGGVQYVLTAVCMYVYICMHVYLISYMSDSKGRLKLGLPL